VFSFDFLIEKRNETTRFLLFIVCLLIEFMLLFSEFGIVLSIQNLYYEFCLENEWNYVVLMYATV
jgi:hypothetical protein